MNCTPKVGQVKKVPKITLVIFGIIFYTNQQQKGNEMKHHIFTQEESSELESNPHIIKVMNCNVEYTEAFKQQVIIMSYSATLFYRKFSSVF